MKRPLKKKQNEILHDDLDLKVVELEAAKDTFKVVRNKKFKNFNC